MHGYGYEDDNEPIPDEEEVIADVLGENPRARDLRLMRAALTQRRTLFKKDFERSQNDQERAGLRTKITELDKQIAALRQEEAITTFVEDSVRVTLHKPSMEDLENEY